MQNCQDTIIILHGWQSSKEKWQDIKKNLEKQGLKVIVPDLPGFKKETELKNPWDLNDYIDWFTLLNNSASSGIAAKRHLTGLKKSFEKPTEPFFLLGHSFGGRIGIKYAAKHPEKLKGLILVSAAGIKHKRTLYIRTILDIIKFGQRFSFLPFYSFFRKIFYKYILRTTDYIKAEKILNLKDTFKKIISEDLTGYLEKIKTPTLIIWGEKDKITSLSDAYLINKKIPNSKLEVLKNVGHSPHREAPKILAEKILNFVKRM